MQARASRGNGFFYYDYMEPEGSPIHTKTKFHRFGAIFERTLAQKGIECATPLMEYRD